MGLPKRKRSSPPESPAPSKKRAAEGEPELAKAANGEPPEAPPLATPPADGNEAPDAAAAAARSAFEKNVDELQARAQDSVENVSHGQGAAFRSRLPGALAVDCPAPAPAIVHRIPSHAGWFQWKKVHTLERMALPEWFSGKNSQKTPETYLEQRNCIITKYRENTRRLLKLEDVQGRLTGDVSGAGRLFGFLDHWGLINYESLSDFSPFLPSEGSLTCVDEANSGALQLSPLVKPALANLFNFETAMNHAPKLLSPFPGLGGNLPLSGLAEATVQESLAAPAVEYHCNSCQADCSKRRYHCQKQADFDLCLDCYSDGKFGQGMTSADFLRLDALTESADSNGGGWSDQETLLLLEALELYGDNWTEIAEHVATKSKAQCILHFVCLPIEDPFLEEMEEPKSALTLQAPAADTAEKTVDCTSSEKDAQDKERSARSKDPSSGEANGASLPAAPEAGGSSASEKENKDKAAEGQTNEKDAPTAKLEEKASEGAKTPTMVEASSAKHPLLAVAESAFCAGPDGLIAFADAGNPVMTQVAFLAAMVGPRVAAAAAQAALRSLSEDDPVGFLSARNSVTLTSPGNKSEGLDSKTPDRSIQGVQSVAPAGGPALSSDNNAASTAAEEARQPDALDKETSNNPSGEGGAAQDHRKEVNASTDAVITDQDAPSIAKVRNAAASALASAAVKAKLLADQEEREIQRLVAGVIENQLKKLELKLKHFNDLESMLGKECDQAEKARGKVYAERARIVASRLSPPSSGTNQMQPAGSGSASYPKTVAHPSGSGTQQRPAGFTFGPSGSPNPGAVYKQPSGQESGPQLLGGASGQQEISQRLPRPTPASNMTSGVK